MRCTEGVWLSVTPTQDSLIVSMDFEGTASFQQNLNIDYYNTLKGVNSIERSAQEGENSFT